MNVARMLPLALGVLLATCTTADGPEAPSADPEAEVVSLLGTPLYRPVFEGERAALLDSNLAVARARYEAAPDDVEYIIWLGRRTAYLWRYKDAVDIYTDGLHEHPADPRLYRHRGHRLITLRAFAKAAADLEHAAELIEGTEDEVEPDGQPNALGIPTSTLHTNIFYHLGLAYYLQGDFEAARAAYERCLEASTNNDMYVATADWLYMTLRRLGDTEAAARLLETVTEDMEIIENTSYHRRLLMYKGILPPEALLEVEEGEDSSLTFATQGYGVGNWYLYNGEEARAEQIFLQVLEGDYWAAFGYIAAEAEIARMRGEG